MSRRRRPEAAFTFGMFDLQQGLAIDHQYDRSPAVPRPHEPVVLRAWAPAAAQGVTVYASVGDGPMEPELIREAGQAYPARRVASHWEAIMPGLPAESVVHYVVAADMGSEIRYADGNRPLRTATVFAHRVTHRRPPKWTNTAVGYQIFVDRFANKHGPVAAPTTPDGWAGGDLHGVTNALPYIADLGATVIWLTPIFSCHSYHGYDAINYFSVDLRFGGNEALRRLVDAAHGLGIKVLLDFVPNHLSDRNPWFLEARSGGATRDWFFFDEKGNYQTFFGVQKMPKVNVDHPAARRALMDAAMFWIEEFGIDGYRIDHVLGSSESFFASLAKTLNHGFPDAWTFGEATATAAFIRRYAGVLDGATDFSTAYALRDLIAGELSPEGFVEVEQEAGAVIPHCDFSWVRFFDNHDMDRALWVWNGRSEALVTATNAIMALPGVPFVFYGTEQALNQSRGARESGLETSRVPMRFDDAAGIVGPLRSALERRSSAPPPSTPVMWDSGRDPLRWSWGPFDGQLETPVPGVADGDHSEPPAN